LIQDLRRDVVRAAAALDHVVEPLGEQLFRPGGFHQPALHRPRQHGTGARRQAPAAPLGQPAARLKIGVVAIQHSREFGDAFAARRHGREDRPLPLGVVAARYRPPPSSPWPTPTVSAGMRATPNASSRSATSSVVVARPPCAPRVAMERMKTCGSRLADSIRMRSPSSAPPVNGLVGSTATAPTESPCPR